MRCVVLHGNVETSVEITKVLLQAGAKVDATDKDGKTPLMVCPEQVNSSAD